ncbi:hypothetical protein EVAR_55231_1 [Eumeta japonica]|uniref:Uncharacterized protein n=1 Tax=Eumeta variegata TaxID=151549 RepID=A0A4C1ZKZ8_EUMVA|nr:hypothetical protein EVAR_55231_1 [Eumeta japonica]
MDVVTAHCLRGRRAQGAARRLEASSRPDRSAHGAVGGAANGHGKGPVGPACRKRSCPRGPLTRATPSRGANSCGGLARRAAANDSIERYGLMSIAKPTFALSNFQLGHYRESVTVKLEGLTRSREGKSVTACQMTLVSRSPPKSI